MHLKPKKKLYSPVYNLLYTIIAIPSEALFVWINEFISDCNVLCRVLLFDGLLLRSLMLIFICSTLNLCTLQFTVDFLITFCSPYTAHIPARNSLPETFSSIKDRITLRCSSLGAVVNVTVISSLTNVFPALPFGEHFLPNRLTGWNMWSLLTHNCLYRNASLNFFC